MDLDKEIDELFALTPDRFTAARDALAKDLKDRGDPSQAKPVKGLRKPTLIAWALNQLVRRHREDVKALIASGDSLRSAQRKVLSGVEGPEFRTAMEARRKLILALARRAMKILGEAGRPSPTARDELARSLEAASTDTDAGASLLEGRLAKPPVGVTGFESFSGLSVVEDASASEAADRKARETELKNAERNAERAEVDARRARVRADTLAGDLEELSRRSEEAAREAERLEEEATEARRRLEALQG
jgi:hypothetical protein